jgi:hypothetical protein
MAAPAAKMGRPATDTESLNVRVARSLLRELDNWRRTQEDLPTRPEAIRRLLMSHPELRPQAAKQAKQKR